jgi:hypothetical protein
MRTTPTIIAESFMADLSSLPELVPLPSGLCAGSEIDMEAPPVPVAPRGSQTAAVEGGDPAGERSAGFR